MDYAAVLKYQNDLVEKYKYKALPPLYRDEALALYSANLPDGFVLDGADVPLFSPDGLRLSNRYNRIVIGDYGAFVEILPEDIINANIQVKKGQEYRDADERYSKHTKYSWLTAKDGSDIKIYFQKKPVDYADYVPGRYYISPYECVLSRVQENKIEPVVSRAQIQGWLNEHGVYNRQLLDYYEELSSLHDFALNYAITHDLFPGDFEYWVRLNEICELDGGLSFEQFSVVRYNLSLIHCSVDELKGQLPVLQEDVRTAIQLGLEEFPFPCEAERIKPNDLRLLLSLPSERLLDVMRLSKVLAGCKCGPLITDVETVIDAATQRVTSTNVCTHNKISVAATGFEMDFVKEEIG